MRRNLLITCAVLMAAVAGCAPTAQEDYDEAVADLKRAEQRLDNLRPGYDEARAAAALQVCKEFAGATPDESAAEALHQLTAAVAEPSAAPAAPTAGKKPIGDADAAIDQLMAAQKDFSDKQATATAPLLKTQEVMRNIKVAGTPEAIRFEQVLADMPQAKTYQRQQQRVEEAKKTLADAEAQLPDEDKAK